MIAEHQDSERAILGACLSIENANAYFDAAAVIAEGDFYKPAHALVWHAIAALAAEAVPTDPILVAERLERDGELDKAGGRPELFAMYQQACAAEAVVHHARLIADAATMRRVRTAGLRMAQRSEEGQIDAADLVRWAGEQVAAARDERQGVDVLTKGWEDFLASSPEQRPMVIPGLLGEGDRLVLTGHGGLGKSTMLQQIAVCAAAGLQPFDWHCEDTFDPVRVSIIDLENPDFRVKTRLWPMVKDAVKFGGADPRPNLFIGGRGNPLNLLDAQNALSLLRTVEHDKPKLVYIGPVYKMHNDDPDKEMVVKKITDVLDGIRAMGVAIISEAHHTKAGKGGGSLEPSGSNLWTWWPEFGLGLRLSEGGDSLKRQCRLETWRINREIASWPSEVEASGQMGLAWARAAAPGWNGAAA